MTVRLLARYRRHNDTAADTVEQTIEADTYADARDQARAGTIDGDNLMSIQVLD
jgi:hypothetical protein